MSLSTTFSHVIFGLPLPLLPSTVISILFFTQSFPSFLNTCPIHFSLLCLITSLIFSMPILSLSSAFVFISLSVKINGCCCCCCNVNAKVYQQVLEYFMLPAGEEILGCADFTFQQDLAPAHSARSTMRWLEDHHGIEVLSWPANLPDLNPIDNLWGLVKRRMSEWPSTQEELKGAIRIAWNSLSHLRTVTV